MGAVLKRRQANKVHLQGVGGLIKGYVNRMEISMKRILSIALLMAGAALLSGCPKKHNVIEPPTAGSQVPGSSGGTEEGASTSGRALNGADGTQGDNMGGATGPLARKIIYFDFDKSEIKAEFADVVAAHARNLTSHPNLKMKLEGNTDERGTREYNIGLGERRAQAVRRALMLQGVAESQLNTVSFGAERPAAEGDDETAWAKNRRVELVYAP
ncbi:MAG: peptidoglycan-associated lipoprotein [Gammaproteobacteria bacterium]|nr:peptidoglycan-associated lipoprotein [Gammaproteobacteria bacterium]